MSNSKKKNDIERIQIGADFSTERTITPSKIEEAKPTEGIPVRTNYAGLTVTKNIRQNPQMGSAYDQVKLGTGVEIEKTATGEKDYTIKTEGIYERNHFGKSGLHTGWNSAFSLGAKYGLEDKTLKPIAGIEVSNAILSRESANHCYHNNGILSPYANAKLEGAAAKDITFGAGLKYDGSVFSKSHRKGTYQSTKTEFKAGLEKGYQQKGLNYVLSAAVKF